MGDEGGRGKLSQTQGCANKIFIVKNIFLFCLSNQGPSNLVIKDLKNGK